MTLTRFRKTYSFYRSRTQASNASNDDNRYKKTYSFFRNDKLLIDEPVVESLPVSTYEYPFFAGQSSGNLNQTFYMIRAYESIYTTESPTNQGGPQHYEIPADGLLTGLLARIETAHQSTNVSDFIVRKNFVDTTMKVTFTAGQTSQTYSGDPIEVAKGDIITLKHDHVTTGSNPGGGRNRVQVVYAPTTSAFSFDMGWDFSTPQPGLTPVYPGLEQWDVPSTTEAHGTIITPYSGRITEIHVRNMTGVIATQPVIVTLRVNNVDTSMTSVMELGVSELLVTGDVSITQGDRVSLSFRVDNVVGTSTFVCKCSIRGVATNHVEMVKYFGAKELTDTFPERMLNIHTNDASPEAGDTLSTRQMYALAGTITRIIIDFRNGPMATANAVFTINKNGVSTGVTGTIPVGETRVVIDTSIDVAASDHISIFATLDAVDGTDSYPFAVMLGTAT